MGATNSRKDSLARGPRCTARRRSSCSPMSAITRSLAVAVVPRTGTHPSRLALLIVDACTPARSAIKIWLRISASSGEIRSVGPAPPSRSRRVAMKYTALLPQPVRCTSSRRARCSTRARMLSSCPARNDAVGPATAVSSSVALASLVIATTVRRRWDSSENRRGAYGNAWVGQRLAVGVTTGSAGRRARRSRGPWSPASPATGEPVRPACGRRDRGAPRRAHRRVRRPPR